MKYLLLLCMAACVGCTNNEPSSSEPEDTASIGVDSTKIGADSGILRKLP